MRANPFDAATRWTPRLATVVGAGCLLIAFGIPVAIAIHWAFAQGPDLIIARLQPSATGDFPAWKRLTGAVFSLIPALIMSWGWLRARAALLAIGQGHAFAPVVTSGLKGYAIASFWSAVASFALHPLMSVALTLDSPPGQHALALNLSSNQLLGVVQAGVVWIIVAALARGAQAADENRQFV